MGMYVITYIEVLKEDEWTQLRNVNFTRGYKGISGAAFASCC